MQLPRKMSAQNVMASITRTLGARHDSKSAAPNEVKFAGEESKDKLYEPKHKQKLVRVLTVVAYVISVSLAAIILSLYYTFVWNPKDQSHNISKDGKVNVISKMERVNLTLHEPSGTNGTDIGRATTTKPIKLDLEFPEAQPSNPPLQKDLSKISDNTTKILNITSTTSSSSQPILTTPQIAIETDDADGHEEGIVKDREK